MNVYCKYMIFINKKCLNQMLSTIPEKSGFNLQNKMFPYLWVASATVDVDINTTLGIIKGLL